MSILVSLEDRGININTQMHKLLVSKDLPLDVLQFIADNRGFEAINFYEMLRKKHNKNKSPLYTNLLKGQDDPKELLITLTCLLTQIALYSKKLDNASGFLNEIRFNDLSKAMYTYSETDSIDEVVKVLNAIKTDLLVLEYLSGRRELAA
jgi:hypothetical protein